MNPILFCYEKLRLITYRALFKQLRERDGSLSATEAYAIDVIYLLREPTVKEFADCIGISQPNATYKINSLMQKGYLEKTPSMTDRRESHLHVTKKFLDYYQRGDDALTRAFRSLQEKFSAEEIELFSRMLSELSDTLETNPDIQQKNGGLADA